MKMMEVVKDGGMEQKKSSTLTVRFLESCSGTTTTKLLWFHSSGVSNQQGLVVSSKNFLQLIFRSFVNKLLVVSNQTFGNGLSDGVNSGHVTSTRNFNSDVNTLEFVQTNQGQWFVDLESQDFWSNQSDWGAVDFDQTFTVLDVSNGGCSLLFTESLKFSNC